MTPELPGIFPTIEKMLMYGAKLALVSLVLWGAIGLAIYALIY